MNPKIHKVETLTPEIPGYPRLLADRRSDFSQRLVFALGDVSLTRHNYLALFCSMKCPGELILKTYDLARYLRDSQTPVIGGFHSPMEKECLDLLLRGMQPLIVCPARSIDRMRIPTLWRKALDEGRLLVLSPFGDGHGRATKDLALRRSHFVAALAEFVFVAYADPGSRTESLCGELLSHGQKVLTFNSQVTARTVAIGATPTDPQCIGKLLRQATGQP